MQLFVSGPKFTKFNSPNAEEIAVDHLVVYSDPVPEVFAIEVLKLSEIASNLARLWPQIFAGIPPPKLRDLDYETEPTFDHVAKFHGDRPTKLKDLALKNRNISSKT